MSDLWVDANLLLRLMTGDPEHLAKAALRLAQQAEQGKVTLKISPLVVAEIAGMLRSYYRYTPDRIASILLPVVTARGVVLEQADLVITSLDLMATANVDFSSAFLAETARCAGGAVASFDRDFRRLEVDWVEPG